MGERTLLLIFLFFGPLVALCQTTPESQNPDELFRMAEKSWRVWSSSGRKDLESWQISTNYYHQAAELGHPEAMIKVGEIFWEGNGGTPIDYEFGCYWFEKADEIGYNTSHLGLAECYFSGLGREKNRQKARALLEKTIEEGHFIDCEKAKNFLVLLNLEKGEVVGVNDFPKLPLSTGATTKFKNLWFAIRYGYRAMGTRLLFYQGKGNPVEVLKDNDDYYFLEGFNVNTDWYVLRRPKKKGEPSCILKRQGRGVWKEWFCFPDHQLLNGLAFNKPTKELFFHSAGSIWAMDFSSKKIRNILPDAILGMRENPPIKIMPDLANNQILVWVGGKKYFHYRLGYFDLKKDSVNWMNPSWMDDPYRILVLPGGALPKAQFHGYRANYRDFIIDGGIGLVMGIRQEGLFGSEYIAIWNPYTKKVKKIDTLSRFIYEK